MQRVRFIEHQSRKIMFRLINSFNGRKLAAFNTREQAQAWLVAQQAPPEVVPDS